MRRALATLTIIFSHNKFQILACCCGHNKYPMTIVVKSAWDGKPFELLSKTDIPRKSRFYVKDKQGYYYIPETVRTTIR